MKTKAFLSRLIVVGLLVPSLLVGAGVLAQAAPSVQAATAPWPMFRYDAQRTGRSANIGPQNNDVLWTYATGGEVNSSPAIDDDGTIYVGSEDSNLYAIERDGSLKWTFPAGGGVYSSPAIGLDGTIYVGSRDHSLYGVFPDGTLRCSFPTGGGVNASPVIGDDGTIYVSSYDGNLYVLNPDCTLQWSYPAGAMSPSIGPDGTIYAGYAGRRLRALNPGGTLKWESDPAGNWIGTAPALSPDGEVVYYGADDGHLYAVHTSDGSLKWKSPWTYGGIQSSPAIDSDGTVYVGTQYGNLWALDPADGSLIWDYYMTLNVQSSPAIGADGTIYFPTTYGHIYAMNPDGTVKWVYTSGGGHFFSSPAIGSSGVLYVGCTDGRLYALGSTRIVAVPGDQEVYPGDTVTVDLNIQEAHNLYAAQATCTIDPAILEPQNGVFGDFFDPVNHLIGANDVDPTAGTWTGAISQRSPAGPLSGDGLLATVTYQALNPGTTSITCEPLLSDRDGFTQPVAFVGAEVTVLPYATVSGTATYQGRLTHAGIDVTATGPVTRTDTTDGDGSFTLDGLRAGSYDVVADATRYLPNCTAVAVDAGDEATLPATVLLGGDVNDDDVINISDATLIGSNFGQTVPPADERADINDDGIVNVQDLAILGGNYELAGCQSW